jgi:hypothetical protein
MAGRRGMFLESDGYWRLDGKRFVPVGVNYWPGSCGVEMWQAWPEDEIRHDLEVIRSLGLNSIRFFLRWQDFEPAPGTYAPEMLERLAQFLAWCCERKLYAQPSLFVGWMSGGIFWPEWKGQRNLFADPWMVERSTAFARRAAEVIAPFHGDRPRQRDLLPARQQCRVPTGGDRLVRGDQPGDSQRLSGVHDRLWQRAEPDSQRYGMALWRAAGHRLLQHAWLPGPCLAQCWI